MDGEIESTCPRHAAPAAMRMYSPLEEAGESHRRMRDARDALRAFSCASSAPSAPSATSLYIRDATRRDAT